MTTSSGVYARIKDDERECPYCGEYSDVEVLEDSETQTDNWNCPECLEAITEWWEDYDE